jgi:hypothetical protein
MSFVTVVPELVTDAATRLANIGSTLSAAYAAASVSTTQVEVAAQDEVSASITGVFRSYAQQYRAVIAQGGLFHAQFVQVLSTGAGAYAATEAAATQLTSPAQALQNLPTVAANAAANIFGIEANIGYGNTGTGNIGIGNTGNNNFGINNIGTPNTVDSGFNIGAFNFGNGNVGAFNHGSVNFGAFNYGNGNGGIFNFQNLPQDFPSEWYGPSSDGGSIGAFNRGFGNQGIGNTGFLNWGIGNTGLGNVGFGVTGKDLAGIGIPGTGIQLAGPNPFSPLF